jgi:hypothetical protein
MALIVITIQDNESGEVSVSAVCEPVLGGDEATPAQRVAANMISSIGDKPKDESRIQLLS